MFSIDFSGRSMNHHYEVEKGTKVVNNTLILSNVMMTKSGSNLIGCVNKCTHSAECHAVNLKQLAPSECVLLNQIPTPADMLPDSDWKVYMRPNATIF